MQIIQQERSLFDQKLFSAENQLMVNVSKEDEPKILEWIYKANNSSILSTFV